MSEREMLVVAVESMEEMTLMLAEVHIRFNGLKMLGEGFQEEGEFTYGDAARMYEQQAKEIRKFLEQKP